MITNDKIKLVNCAGCECVLLGESMTYKKLPYDYKDTPLVAGRIKDRPYCEKCLYPNRVVKTKDSRDVARQKKLDRLED